MVVEAPSGPAHTSPASLGHGWCPDSTSMMLSRRTPIAIPSSRNVPRSSGPRWVIQLGHPIEALGTDHLSRLSRHLDDPTDPAHSATPRSCDARNVESSISDHHIGEHRGARPRDNAPTRASLPRTYLAVLYRTTRQTPKGGKGSSSGARCTGCMLRRQLPVVALAAEYSWGVSSSFSRGSAPDLRATGGRASRPATSRHAERSGR